MHYCLVCVFPSEYDCCTENEDMEEQENADYTVFLDLEKQILADLGPVKGQEILSSSDA